MASVDSRNWWTKNEKRVKWIISRPVLISYTVCEMSSLQTNIGLSNHGLFQWNLFVESICNLTAVCPRPSRWSWRRLACLASPSKGPPKSPNHAYIGINISVYIYIILYIYIIIINTIIYIILYRCPKCICTVIMHNYNEISEELQSNRFWYMSAYHAFFAYEVDSQCIHCHISPTQQDKSCFRENIKQ